MEGSSVVAEESALEFGVTFLLWPALVSSKSHCLPSSGEDTLRPQLISAASLAVLIADYACHCTVMWLCSQLPFYFQTWGFKQSRNGSSFFFPNKNLWGCEVKCLWSNTMCPRLPVGSAGWITVMQDWLLTVWMPCFLRRTSALFSETDDFEILWLLYRR